MKYLWICIATLPLAAFALHTQAQQTPVPSTAAAKSLEVTPLGKASRLGITQIPLEVDMSLAEQFVRIGFGPQILGQRGFQSTQFLTPPLNTTQAAQLVLVVPEYGRFKGPLVAQGIKRFTGRVSSVQFGRKRAACRRVTQGFCRRIGCRGVWTGSD